MASWDGGSTSTGRGCTTFVSAPTTQLRPQARLPPPARLRPRVEAAAAASRRSSPARRPMESGSSSQSSARTTPFESGPGPGPGRVCVGPGRSGHVRSLAPDVTWWDMSGGHEFAARRRTEGRGAWKSGTPSYSLAPMRQLVFHGPWKLAVEEAEPPPLAADEVRVAVHSVGVCGSAIHGYAGINARRQPGMVMGHEAVGTVAEVGAAVEGVEPGQRVVVDPILSCGRCDLCLAGHDKLCESRPIYGCVPGLAGAY